MSGKLQKMLSINQIIEFLFLFCLNSILISNSCVFTKSCVPRIFVMFRASVSQICLIYSSPKGKKVGRDLDMNELVTMVLRRYRTPELLSNYNQVTSCNAEVTKGH